LLPPLRRACRTARARGQKEDLVEETRTTYGAGEEPLTARLEEFVESGGPVDRALEEVEQAPSRFIQGARELCDRTMDLVRERPGQSALVLFGAGLGLGMLALRRSPSPLQRMTPAFSVALLTLARKALRERFA
jgi:ElaB/YqjD/DUF883 family membrane-anchored ribosome-binding protein